MSDLRDLYQDVILEHSKTPRNFRAQPSANHKAEGLNPLCGDRFTVYVTLEGDAIKDVSFQGAGCAISKASASMMTTNVKGKSQQEVETLVQEFRDMATGKLDVATQSHHLGRLAVFAGVKDLPSRVKCAILPWHTLHAAFHNQQSASTEGEADPMGSPATQ